MRVLIVNTSENAGGAAVAAHRLMETLNKNGVKAKMLVREKVSDGLTIVPLPQSFRLRWNFLWERLCIFLHLHLSRKSLFEIDIANTGTDITALREFQEADIIHLHWINQGMLSLKNIRKILDSGKPVVWTMHDIWPATSICHLTLGCTNFTQRCQHCKYLPNGGGKRDLSARVWKRKEEMLNGHRIHFVACSRWLADEARKSALLSNQPVTSIPNPIDTSVFSPSDKNAARQRLSLPADKRLLLFVSQRVTNRNKGMTFLVDACRKLVADNPKFKENTGIVILGGHSEELENAFELPTFALGYVSDTQKIVDVYNAVDLFVLPSLSENLPNTIMEAMACGKPCIGFEVGGIPEEIDHLKNGYVAKFMDADDLAKGIHWVLDEADYQSLSQSALQKVARNYSQQNVAARYIELYSEISHTPFKP